MIDCSMPMSPTKRYGETRGSNDGWSSQRRAIDACGSLPLLTGLTSQRYGPPTCNPVIKTIIAKLRSHWYRWYTIYWDCSRSLATLSTAADNRLICCNRRAQATSSRASNAWQSNARMHVHTRQTHSPVCGANSWLKGSSLMQLFCSFLGWSIHCNMLIRLCTCVTCTLAWWHRTNEYIIDRDGSKYS